MGLDIFESIGIRLSKREDVKGSGRHSGRVTTTSRPIGTHGDHYRSGQGHSSTPLVFLSLILTTLFLCLPPGDGSRHRCYVCLPSDKDSAIAKDILTMFPGQTLPDCSDIPTEIDEETEVANAQKFILNCPQNHSGCLLRLEGSQTSRTCTLKKFQRCVMVNAAELCYCAHSLCNLNKSSAQAKPEAIRNSRHFTEGETDDEDLLQATGGPRPHFQGHTSHGQHHDTHEHEEEGSGYEPELEEEREEVESDQSQISTTSTSPLLIFPTNYPIFPTNYRIFDWPESNNNTHSHNDAKDDEMIKLDAKEANGKDKSPPAVGGNGQNRVHALGSLFLLMSMTSLLVTRNS